jgi:2'-aminobiphenyl-2,3-diol 1,2-dioxygenase small subunit
MTGIPSASGAEDRYAINRLVQDLFAQPGRLEAFRTRRAELCREYALSDAQAAALARCDREALTAAGVHPILQMHLFLANDPQVAGFITVKAYLDPADTEDLSHG